MRIHLTLFIQHGFMEIRTNKTSPHGVGRCYPLPTGGENFPYGDVISPFGEKTSQFRYRRSLNIHNILASFCFFLQSICTNETKIFSLQFSLERLGEDLVRNESKSLIHSRKITTLICRNSFNTFMIKDRTKLRPKRITTSRKINTRINITCTWIQFTSTKTNFSTSYTCINLSFLPTPCGEVLYTYSR